MSDYNPDDDVILEELGDVPGTKLRVRVRRFKEGMPKVAITLLGKVVEGVEREHPVKRLSVPEAIALGAFLVANTPKIEAHL